MKGIEDKPGLIEIILNEISEGTPLRQICRENDIGKSTVYDWMKEDEDFAGRFARAREIGFDIIAENCLEIADDTEEDPASRRVRVDTRLKLLAKWDPKRYGDKMQHTGADGKGPVEHSVTTITRTIVDPSE